MDSKTALFLALVVCGFFVIDQLFLGWNAHVFLGIKLSSLIEYAAFWR